MQQVSKKVNNKLCSSAQDAKRFYEKKAVCHFCKAGEQWGEFGNMTGRFPIRINSNLIAVSVESLYQAMRFSSYPQIQEEVIGVKQGFGAKLKAKKYRKTHSRSEFDAERVEIMRWCLRLKLAHHERFGELLLETGEKEIVEVSCRDDFWGCKHVSSDLLYGNNMLGKLLMEVREEYRNSLEGGKGVHKQVIPPSFKGFNFWGCAVSSIDLRPSRYQPNLIPEYGFEISAAA